MLMTTKYLYHGRNSWSNATAMSSSFLFSRTFKHLPLSLSGLCLSWWVLHQGKVCAPDGVDRPGNAAEHHEVSAEQVDNMRSADSK